MTLTHTEPTRSAPLTQQAPVQNVEEYGAIDALGITDYYAFSVIQKLVEWSKTRDVNTLRSARWLLDYKLISEESKRG